MLDMLISYDYSSKRFGFMKHDCDCFLLPDAHCVAGYRTKGGLFTPPLSTKLPAGIPMRSRVHHPLNPVKFFLMFLFGLGFGALVMFMCRACMRKKDYKPLRTVASPSDDMDRDIELTRFL